MAKPIQYCKVKNKIKYIKKKKENNLSSKKNFCVEPCYIKWRLVQNSLLDSVGEGEGGKIWENGIET